MQEEQFPQRAIFVRRLREDFSLLYRACARRTVQAFPAHVIMLGTVDGELGALRGTWGKGSGGRELGNMGEQQLFGAVREFLPTGCNYILVY